MTREASKISYNEWSPDLMKSRAYEQLLLDIILGVLAPGERLDESDLASRYECGVAGIRDALGRLALEGLVVRRARVGTMVAPLDLVEVKEAFDARFLIEAHCAGLAAQHATESDIQAIRTAFDGAEKAVEKRDYRALVAMDEAFHVAVARAGKNATLMRIVITLHHKAARYWVFTMTSTPPEERLAGVGEHLQVADAIAAGDVEGSKRAMRSVLGEFPDTVKRTMTFGSRA